MASSQGEERYTISVLVAALKVIEFLAHGCEDDGGCTATEIAAQLGLHRNRVFRILKTLEYCGYVKVDPEARTYRLSVRFLQIGQQVQTQLGLRSAARPVLGELAEKTGDVASLWVLHDRGAVCLDWHQGAHMLQFLPSIGRALPLYIGAAPKVLLAHLPEDEREQIVDQIEFKAYTPNTITDAETLRRCLEDIRSEGYAVDEEDYEYGEHAFGAPIRNHTGEVVAALSVVVPKSRYVEGRQGHLIELVVAGAEQVSQNLGFADRL